MVGRGVSLMGRRFLFFLGQRCQHPSKKRRDTIDTHILP